MGQQQLLLLVLGIVIVGLAVVVGIQAFSENQTKANADAMVNDAVRIASDAQAWALKPSQFGGGSGSFQPLDATGTAASITFTNLGYSVGDQPGGHEALAAEYENLNGIYTIAASDDDALLITGNSYKADGETVSNLIQIAVCGFEYNDIKTVQGVGGTTPTCS